MAPLQTCVTQFSLQYGKTHLRASKACSPKAHHQPLTLVRLAATAIKIYKSHSRTVRRAKLSRPQIISIPCPPTSPFSAPSMSGAPASCPWPNSRPCARLQALSVCRPISPAAMWCSRLRAQSSRCRPLWANA